jgi:2-polyprenyl-3-methyl-5-hydroxy-6-metoxy-1,4-benzoquinol methylase
LDIGSGNGFLCAKLSELGYNITGLEPDKQGYGISTAQYPHLKFHNLGVEADPSILVGADKDLFDVVISTEVIEHLYLPNDLPLLAGKVLKANGFLVISTPYHGYLKNLALAIVDKWDFHHHPLVEGGHIKFWSRRTLTQLLEENNFEVRSFHGVGRIPYLWKSMILVSQKRN